MPPIDIAQIKSAKVYSSAGEVVRFMHDHHSRVISLANNGDPDARRVARSIHFRDESSPVVLKETVSTATPGDASKFRALAEARGIVWEDAYADRFRAYWASDERVDRYGDIVRQFWDFQNFLKNPILLYGHDWGGPPIGNSVQELVTTRAEQDYSGAALWMLVLFASQWEWADTIFKLVKAGFLRTGSVGLFPGAVIDVQDAEERNRLGLGKWGLIYGTKEIPNQLVEYSVATVPGNPGSHFTTLRDMARKQEIGPEAAVLVKELARLRHLSDSFSNDGAWITIDRSLTSLFRAVFPGRSIPKHDDPSVTVLADVDEVTAPDQTSVQVPDARFEAITKRLDDLSNRIDSLTESVSTLSLGSRNDASTSDDDESASINHDLEAALDSSRKALAALGDPQSNGAIK